jgi:hypothetical protein
MGKRVEKCNMHVIRNGIGREREREKAACMLLMD